jgi:hypothetical protein
MKQMFLLQICYCVRKENNSKLFSPDYDKVYTSFYGNLMMKYVVGSKSIRPDIQKSRQMENAVRDI